MICSHLKSRPAAVNDFFMTKAKSLYFLIKTSAKWLATASLLVGLIACQKTTESQPNPSAADDVVVEYSNADLKENLQGLWQEPNSGVIFNFESNWDDIKKSDVYSFQSPGFFDEYALPFAPMTEVRFEFEKNLLIADLTQGARPAVIKLIKAKADGITLSVEVQSGDKLKSTLKLTQVDTAIAMELARKQSHTASIAWSRRNAASLVDRCSEQGDFRQISNAVRTHNYECVRKLISKVPNSPQFLSLKNQWYLDSVAELDVGIAELILESGADMNAFDDDGRNAMQILMLSAKNLKFNFKSRKVWLDYRPMLLLLTQMGVDYNEPDLTGISTFHRLLLHEDIYVGNLLKTMIENGAQFEVTKSRDQFMYERFFVNFEQRLGAERHYILQKVLENISIGKRLTRKSYFTFLKTAAIFGDLPSFEILERFGLLTDANLMVMTASLKEEIFARENEMPVQLNDRQLRMDYLKNIEKLKANLGWLDRFASQLHPSQSETQ